MKKIILLILYTVICFSILYKTKAEEANEKLLSAGLGMAILPGYYNPSYDLMLETRIYSKFKLFGELGYSNLLYGLGGIRYYIIKASSFFQPKISIGYGPNSFPDNSIKVYLYGTSSIEKVKYGAIFGFGFFLAFTKDRTAGLDIDYYFGLSNTDNQSKPNNQYISFKIKILF